MTDYQRGTRPHTYWVVDSEGAEAVDGGVIDEVLLSIYVNVQEVATIMCSPVDEEALALGFLVNEGVITSLDDVGHLQLNANRTLADVFLTRADFSPPRRLTITSGCGGGVTLQNLAEHQPPLETDFTTSRETVLTLIPQLPAAGQLYQAVRGVHTAILADGEQVLLTAEDVGRHNTIDKLAGKALQQGIDTTDKILMTSGRVSSEMVNKARVMRVPLVVSRTAPTAMAVELAEIWGICVCGYARRGSFRVYTHPVRLAVK